MFRTCENVLRKRGLKACDEICGKKKGGEVKGTHGGGIEANMARYKNMKNRAKKVVAKAMK